MQKRKRVVIVGGGFGGLAAAQHLTRSDLEVVLLDRRNYHLFQPLLYQVATAALSPADIAEPIRRVLRHRANVQVLLGEVSAVDLGKKVVHWDKGEIAYDYVVLAAGATHAYFGHDEWRHRAPGLKTIDDAVEIRRRLLLSFEAAEVEDDPDARRAELSFVVVGGGPTGVELAGALREIAVESIQRDFRRVDTASARILLVEGQSRLLPSMSERASAGALKQLEQLGVEVRLDTIVSELTDDVVYLKSQGRDEQVHARNVIWAAGVQAAALTQTLGVSLDRSGRVEVEDDCSIPGFPQAFAIGDLASFTETESGQTVPGVAQGALQMGRFVAQTISREVADPSARRSTFRYRDKGSLATVGRGKAVADLGRSSFSGFFAWLLWSVVHVAFLITFRTRAFVMAGWAFSYVAKSRGPRLITGGPAANVRRPAEF